MHTYIHTYIHTSIQTKPQPIPSNQPLKLKSRSEHRPSPPKVPCSTVVDLAKAVSTAAGSSTCKAVQEISKARAKDAENSVHKVLAKYNLALPIPLSPVEGTNCSGWFSAS